MEDEGFANHGEFRGAEFVFTVVTDEDVLDDGFQFGRKAGNGVHGFVDVVEFHDDMAEELTFGGVADGTFIAKFIELTNVVEQSGDKESARRFVWPGHRG
jgi:hypothetical protein